MVKAIAIGDRGKVLLLGVAASDFVKMLQEGIVVDLRPFGVEMEVLLVGGTTDEEIKSRVESAVPTETLPKGATPQDIEDALKKDMQ